MTEHKPKNVIFARSQRHTDADFMCALPSSVSRYAVNAYGGENQSEQAECADKSSGNALAKAGKQFLRFKRVHVEHHEVGILPMDGSLDRLADNQRISGHSRVDNHVGPVDLIQR